MNESITDGNITIKEKNIKGKHLYSVLRSLASRIEQCHHDLTKIESNTFFKSQLIQHQQEVTLDILKGINSSSTEIEALDENEELEIGTRILFKNNSINFGNTLFYDKRIEGKNNKDTSDITIQYASQSFNINQWTIRTMFNKCNPNLDLLIVPISNTVNMESEIFKSENSETSDLVLKMKTPQHYSDPNLSVKCMVIKRDTTNPNQTQFEYLGSIQPSSTDKLFGIKPSPIEIEQPDIQHVQFILMRNNKSHSGTSIEQILKECLSNELGMNISENPSKTDSPTIPTTNFEFNTLSKGYSSSLYYRVQYYSEQVVENESSLICNLYADTNETVMLVIEKIQQTLKSENVILLLSPLTMMNDRRELISSLSREIKHVIFKLHDHVKKMTLMNPQEREIQNDILIYLQLQMESDKSDREYIKNIKSDDIDHVNELSNITDIHYVMNHLTRKLSIDLTKFDLNKKKELIQDTQMIHHPPSTTQQNLGKSPGIKKPLPLTPQNAFAINSQQQQFDSTINSLDNNPVSIINTSSIPSPTKINTFTEPILSTPTSITTSVNESGTLYPSITTPVNEVSSPIAEKRIKPLPKPALLDTKEIMYTTIMGSTKENTDQFWKLDSYNELKSLSYEILLLNSNGLVDFSGNRENLDAILNTVRKYCGVSKNEHFEMVKRVTNSASFTNSLNTIDSVEYYQTISKIKLQPSTDSKTSLQLWKLIGLVLKNENLDIIKQYSQVFYNNLLLFLKQQTNINFKLNNITFTDMQKLEEFLNEEFTNFDDSDSINDIIQIYTKLNSDIVTPLIKQIPSTGDLIPYLYPLNIKLYSYLSDTRVLSLLKLAKSGEIEIPYDIDDVMNDEIDLSDIFIDLIEDEEVTKSLKLHRKVLNISETMDIMCYIDSVFRMEQNCQTDTDLLLLCDRYLLCLLQYYIKHTKFSNYSKEELSLYNNVFNNMRHILGNSLMDFTSSYTIDHEVFSSHLKLFKYVYYIMQKNENNLTNLSTVFDYITKLSMRKQYERIKSSNMHSASEQAGSNNIIDDSVVLDELVKFGKDILEELSYQQSTFFTYLGSKDYYPNAFIDSLYLNLSNYLKDVQTVFSKYVKTEVSGGVFEIFEIFESFLKIFNEYLFNDEELELTDLENIRKEYPFKMSKLFEPNISILRVPMNNWMNNIQNQYFKYLENSVKLEKFEPISQEVMYSSSHVDLFTFVRQGLPTLYKLCMPNAMEYFRHFNQCLSGLMQRYCVHMVHNLPKVEDFIPKKIQPFSSITVNTSGNGVLKKLMSSGETADNTNGFITPRFESNGISYEELFVRLANLVNTRRQYIKVVKELIEKSDNYRLLFVGKTNTNSTSLPATLLPIDFYSNLEGTSELLKDFIKQLTEIIGCRNIYHELYNNLFGELYLPTVKDMTLSKMIEDYFEPCLESLVEMTDDPNCVEWIIMSMFRHLIKSLQFIIIDGYISQNEFHLNKRQYSASDTKYFLSDLSLIEKFFYSDGEGISDWNFIIQTTGFLKNVIANVMDKASEYLINGSNQNPAFETLSASITPKTPFSKNVVYKVLFNRTDLHAKKFIKNHKFRYGYE
ncbi:predicted protein [Naegleria gruberi]|uniref:Predicted protein n=1 Tax=Naegleria gruberi TaxID=5762 RepID=D2UYM0_NAEGR|nr:uncharacterized protein NAEGRDRAFT_45210 [Naegleria gruberi]EFC50496.1 predicted protein [Naegleria gruberi]|eukprot:XP_002683240.1 predicted protein [Naegleria gruberi strain NEG-M]